MRIAPPSTRTLVEHSLAVIQAGQADTGAYIASPDFPTYHYCWFRDGAFIADAMDRHGRHDSAAGFHRWATSVIAARRHQIDELVARAEAGDTPDPDEHLRTRYTLDGREAEGFWENFQLDGYGTWLWALRNHHDRVGGLPDLDVAAATVQYLATFWAEPSYDWWEEHLQQRHVSTLGAIWAGLDAAAGWPELPASTRTTARDSAQLIRSCIARDGIVGGSLTKWLGSDAVDASLVACLTPFGLYAPDHPVARTTVARIDAELAPAGVHRYRDDVYYGGGQWVLLAGFLAWHHLRAGDRSRAEELVGWMVDQAHPNGDLPEQVADDGLLAPDQLQPWVDKWGPSASPLLWSHAMLLHVTAELDQTDQQTASTA